jgi:hypothetical protein
MVEIFPSEVSKLYRPSDGDLGLDAAFYMTVAGVVEFAPAFALGWARLACCSPCVLLALLPSSARSTPSETRQLSSFLIAVFADGHLRAQRSPVIAPAWCAVAIAGLSRYTTLLMHYFSAPPQCDWPQRVERCAGPAACDFACIH